MGQPNSIVCIQCGHEVQDPPVLNQDAQGRNCRPCADRVLDAQPHLLPADVADMAPRVPKLVLVRDEDEDGDWRPEPA